MDQGTVEALINLAAVALPFAVAGVVWVESKLTKTKKDLKISNEQGDLIVALAKALYAPIKAQYAADATKKAALDEGEAIVADIVATWENEAGTTEVLEKKLERLEELLAEL